MKRGVNIDYRIILSIAILIVALSVGYYFVLYLPQKEQRQIDLQKQQQQAKDKKEEEIKAQSQQALSDCISDAETNYSNNWFRECKSRGSLTSRCISLHEMTFDEYAKQNNIPSGTENIGERLKAIDTFYKERDDCSCRLPLDLADRLNKILENEKDLCLKKYPQN
jgi:hypothetical protein